MSAITLAVIIIAIIFNVLAKRERKKIETGMEANNFTIRPSKVFSTYAIILSFIFATFSFFRDMFFFGVIFLLACSFTIIVLFERKIKIKDNQIICTPVFGKEETYIEAYHETPDGIFAVKTEKLFTISKDDPGYDIFISRLKSEGIPIIEDNASIF